jgi:hypothetical protein
MQKLSDTQLVIVAAACHRADRNLLPLPVNLKGGAAQKVVASLLAKGLAEEQPAAAAGAPAWREGEDGQRFTLLATDAAFEALGIEPEIKEAGPIEQQDDNAAADEQTEPAPEPEPVALKTRAGTKQADLVAMLRRPEGASLDEIVAATGWRAHTVRGAIAGALKKKLGLTVTSEKVDGRGRVYRVAS